MSDNGDEPDEIDKRFEAYTDYQSVSMAVAKSIDDAVDSFVGLEAAHAEGKVRPRQAIDARRNIMAAALKLLPELRANKDANDTCKEIHTRWEKDGSHKIDTDEEWPPYLEGFDGLSLQDELPEWLKQFTTDIRQAGWEVGYLQAGRTVSESNLEPADEQARAMFES